ncbi:type II secretion system minor pseudopilin GspK [Kordiimonas aestuarii]|uniref:type II secretion system minor pseudopilin GspK n=1 Tax=Kordiimonas aestuarii TaxID=1005925 RepID=UPI0021D33EB7|nr:type II secretion system minor pseudopilin GspK [Kordiimonas aestuarii]
MTHIPHRFLHRFADDRGAALVTILLLVAIMSVGAALAFERIGFSVKRATAVKTHDQARLYALGGEAMALAAAEELYKANAKLVALTGAGEGQRVSYQLDGGAINGLLSDATNCFNINSLVVPQHNVYIADQAAMQRFAHLAHALGLSDFEGEKLAAGLADWLDSDSRSLPSGAEDYDYAALSPPYRAANTLMVDISELRLVRGFTPEIRSLLEPQLCVRHKAEPVKLNANTLKVVDAPLLVALVGKGLDLEAAQRALAERPAGGYADNAAFWRHRVFAGLTLEQAVRSRVTVKPQAFDAKISVTYHDATVELVSTLALGDDGRAEVIARRFGAIY